jgi:translation initiation factor 3 subunit E
MAAETNGAPSIAEQYDLLPKMIPYLDRHLVFPLLNDMEPSPEIDRLKFELLKSTNMTDFVGDLDKQIHNLSEAPAEYAKKRDEVLRKRKQYEEDTEKIQRLLESEEVVGNLRSDKVANLNYLKDNHGVTPEMVNALYDFGMFQYSVGAYGDAAELLYKFRVLVRHQANTGTSSNS